MEKTVGPCTQPCLIQHHENTFRLSWFIGTSEWYSSQIVFKLHEQRMITTWIIFWKPSDLLDVFFAPSQMVQIDNYIQRRLRYQMGIHKFQGTPAEASSDGFNFMQEIQKKVNKTKHDNKFIITMDQMPVSLISLQADFGQKRCEDSQHLYIYTGHRISHFCSDCVCGWCKVASNVEFQRYPTWLYCCKGITNFFN